MDLASEFSNKFSYHYYFESSFSPETLSIYNINDKNTLDKNLNGSRVQHFIRRFNTQNVFVPSELMDRMDINLSSLHHGWCSYVMELIKGDLQLVKMERSKAVQDDELIAEIGDGIDKLMDTLEIAFRLYKAGDKMYQMRPRPIEKRNEEPKPYLQDLVSCWNTTIIHHQSSSKNQKIKIAPTVIRSINNIDNISEQWQLFFEVLTRTYQSASYLVQENIETSRGNLNCSHTPELQKALTFMRSTEGRLLQRELQKTSEIYQPSESKQITINTSTLERHPFLSNDSVYRSAAKKKMQDWRGYWKQMFPPPNYESEKMSIFSETLNQLPWVFEYLVLYFLAGDSLCYGFDKEDRKEYFDWITDVFEVARFFSALAFVTRQDFDAALTHLRSLDDSAISLANSWEGFINARDRLRCGSAGATTGVWSVLKDQFLYHHLKPLVLRWRWCTHVKRPGKLNLMQAGQIKRELHCLKSLEQIEEDQMMEGGLVDSGGMAAGGGTGKKKKKKSAVSGSNKSTRMSPQDDPLLFLLCDYDCSIFVPRRFAEPATGASYLLAELDRLQIGLPKLCGYDPTLAEEIADKLREFPGSVQWAVHQHLCKNPFPDQPLSFINLWQGIGVPGEKEERAQIVLLFIDWVRSLFDLNVAWALHIRNQQQQQCGGSGKSQVATSQRMAGDGDSTGNTALPRLHLMNQIKGRGILMDTIRLEIVPPRLSSNSNSNSNSTSNPCSTGGQGEPTRSSSSGRPLSSETAPTVPSSEAEAEVSRWLWIAHCLLVGWKTAKLLATTEESELKLLIDRLRAAKCESSLADKPPFDPLSATSVCVEQQLAPLCEGVYWASVESAAKEHCIYVFADFLYRNWATQTVVLDSFRCELKTLPHSLQFAYLQSLCYASSPLEQEAIVWVLRYIIKVAGESHSHSSDSYHLFTAPPPPPPPTTTTAATTTTTSREVQRAPDSGASPPSPSPSPSPPSLSANRLGSLYFECLLLVKMRFSEIENMYRWKYSHEEVRYRSTLDELKEELTTACATAKNLSNDLSAGNPDCPFLDESKQSLSFAKHSNDHATKAILLDQMWLSALGGGSSGAGAAVGALSVGGESTEKDVFA